MAVFADLGADREERDRALALKLVVDHLALLAQIKLGQMEDA